MSKETLIVDNDFLVEGYKRAGQEFIDEIARTYDVVITDAVKRESTTNLKYPKDLSVEKAIKSGQFRKVDTLTELEVQLGQRSPNNAGEISIQEVQPREAALNPYGVKIGSHDKFFEIGPGKPLSQSLITADQIELPMSLEQPGNRAQSYFTRLFSTPLGILAGIFLGASTKPVGRDEDLTGWSTRNGEFFANPAWGDDSPSEYGPGPGVNRLATGALADDGNGGGDPLQTRTASGTGFVDELSRIAPTFTAVTVTPEDVRYDVPGTVQTPDGVDIGVPTTHVPGQYSFTQQPLSPTWSVNDVDPKYAALMRLMQRGIPVVTVVHRAPAPASAPAPGPAVTGPITVENGVRYAATKTELATLNTWYSAAGMLTVVAYDAKEKARLAAAGLPPQKDWLDAFLEQTGLRPDRGDASGMAPGGTGSGGSWGSPSARDHDGDLTHDTDPPSPDGPDDEEPVLLDLDGNGVRLVRADLSSTWLDGDGDGLSRRMAWAGAGDGVLVYDADGNGRIGGRGEIVLTGWAPGPGRRSMGPRRPRRGLAQGALRSASRQNAPLWMRPVRCRTFRDVAGTGSAWHARGYCAS